MTVRFFRLLACQLLLAFACVSAQAAEIEINLAKIESSEDGYRLDARYAFDLNPSLELALQKGLHLSFTTDISLTRPRWFWWTDERAVSLKRTVDLSYDPLTRVYRVSSRGSLQQNCDTLDDALRWIRRPDHWLIAPKGALKVGEIYNVTLRMYMDRELFAKPLQVDALNNSDLRLTSLKISFPYRAE